MYIASFKALFFDFDGVIKDSVEVKSDAFYYLFFSFGKELALRVKKHHEYNGGMSRYDKLPIYLKWAEQPTDEITIEKYASKFSQMVSQRVIDSPWVCGVLDYLQNKCNKHFYLVSATPQEEIELILKVLNIDSQFEEIVGSPTEKGVAIGNIMNQYHLLPNDCVMIGDAKSDYKAAIENSISFVLRKTSLNTVLQEKLGCEMIDDFCK